MPWITFPPGDTDPCDISYEQAVQNCWDTYPDPPSGRVYGRRGLGARSGVRDARLAKKSIRARDLNGTQDMSAVFDIVDKDGNGVLNFPEYIQYVNYTSGGAVIRAKLPYVRIFKR